MNRKIDADIITAIDQFCRLGIEHPKIRYINSGKSGDVYAYEDAFAIKIFKQSTKHKNDPFLLRQLNGIERVPRTLPLRA